MSEAITLESYKKANRITMIKEKKKGFKIHLLVYVLVNIALCIINLLTNPERLWFFGPLFGWGVGVLSNYIFGFVMAEKAVDKTEAQIEFLAKEM
jgi:hypothetical protein